MLNRQLKVDDQIQASSAYAGEVGRGSREAQQAEGSAGGQAKSARMSSADRPEENAPSLSITEENSSALRAFSAMTFSSIVPDAISRYTITFLVSPMRCVRSTACASVAGFHQGSSRKQ